MSVEKYGWAIKKSLFASTIKILNFPTPARIQKRLTQLQNILAF